MGIEYEDMRTIFSQLKKLKKFENLLILGDAFVHFKPSDYQNLATEEKYPLLTIPQSMNSFTIGSSLGFSLTETLDINGKATLCVDLTKPLPSELIEKYDCIIDAGVLFWCFEPGAALKNIYKMAKPGGIIIHITAISGYYGRGYYNIHPRLFEDFYLGNKAKFLISTYRTKYRKKMCWVKKIMCRFIRFSEKNYVNVNEKHGNIFLDFNKKKQYHFTDYSPGFDPDLIPNNFTGVLAFKKKDSSDNEVMDTYNV